MRTEPESTAPTNSKSNVVLICFALGSTETFKNVASKSWVEVKEDCPKAAVLLVGTKSDLWNKSAPDVITQPKIDKVVATSQADKFIACSAKKNVNSGNGFDFAIGATISKNRGKCSVAETSINCCLESFVGRPFYPQKTGSCSLDGRLRLYRGSYLFAWQQANALTGGMCAQRYEKASLYR
jgi:hypothetical protein